MNESQEMLVEEYNQLLAELQEAYDEGEQAFDAFPINEIDKMQRIGVRMCLLPIILWNNGGKKDPEKFKKELPGKISALMDDVQNNMLILTTHILKDPDTGGKDTLRF